jgi:heat shock protein HtpX
MNQLKTIILLGLLTGLLLAAGQLLGGTNGLSIALIFSFIMNIGTYYFSDKIVLAMYHAKPCQKKHYPKIHQMVEEVCRKANMPKPKIYIIPTKSPNAFATGRNPKNAVVAYTEGILELLTDDELKGVTAHEISHVKNRDILLTTIAATIAGVISYLAHMAQWFAIFGRDDEGNNPIQLLLLAIVTPIIAMIIQLAISRSREYLADETGAKTIQNGTSLASALHKIHTASGHIPMKLGNEATANMFIINPFSAHGLVALLSTHPPVEERIKRLRETNFQAL